MLKHPFYYFESLDSTNNYALKHIFRLKHFSIIMAGYQMRGRGQFDRQWQSNKGENMLFSLVLKKPAALDFNAKVIEALLSTLRDYGIEATYKIPNDIYVGTHKLCGTLIETGYSNATCEYAIIGIGLNVNQVHFDALHATSMRQLTQKKYDVFDVMSTLCKSLEKSFL